MTRCPACGRRWRHEHRACPRQHTPPAAAAAAEAKALPAAEWPVIAGYALSRHLGAGGFGEVFAGTHLATARPTALKVATRVGPSVFAQLEREASWQKTVGPPSAPEVFELGRTSDGRPFLAMELLSATPVSELMAEAQGPLAPASLLLLARALAAAVADLHRRGVTHLDLKPENLFVGQGRTCVIDYGLARQREQSDASHEAESTDTFAGTAEYMAPEQCAAHQRLSPAADVYALGVMLYELATGRPPFIGAQDEVFEGHLGLRPSAPSTHAPVAASLETVIMRCLEKQPEHRFADASALELALSTVDLAQTASTATAAQVAPRPASASAKRSVGVVFFRSGTPVVRFGGGVAHLKADQQALVFELAAPDEPLKHALRAADALVGSGVAPAAVVDVLTVSARGRPGGDTRYTSSDLAKDPKYPVAKDRGVLLTSAAAELLVSTNVSEVPERPGFFSRVVDPIADHTASMTRIAHAPLVGRRSTLEALLVHARAHAGRSGVPTSGVVSVVGEIGHGKTHLAATLGTHLRQELPGATVVELRANETVVGERSTTLQLFVAWLLQVKVGQPPTDQGRALLTQTLGPQASLWEGAAAVLGWLDAMGPELAAYATAPVALQSLMARGAGEVIRSFARARPLVLVLDDAHFADSLLLDAIEYATAADARVTMWVCAIGRPSFATGRPTWGARATARLSLNLEALDREHAHELMALCLKPAEHVPVRVLDRLVDATVGVPLLIVELGRSLRREGLVRRREGTTTHYLAIEALEDLPDSRIAQWMAERELKSMPAAEAAHARLASLFPGKISVVAFSAALRELEREGAGAEFPLDARVGLARLVGAGLLIRHREGDLSFRHAVVQDAIARSVAEPLRTNIHLAAYRVYRAQTSSDDALSHSAHHAAEAGLKDEAAALSLTVASHALRRQDYADAEKLYGNALELLPAGDPRRLVAARGRGLMRYRLGQYESAVADLAVAADLAAPNDPSTHASILLEAATAYDWLNNYARSKALVDQARSVAATAPSDALVEAGLHLGLGRASWRFSNWPEALRELDLAANQAKALGAAAYEVRVVSLLILGYLQPLFGQIEAGEQSIREVIDLAQSHQDRLHLATAYNNRRSVRTARGDIEGAVADQREYIDIGREFGARLPIYYGLFNIAEIYHLANRPEALPAISQLVDFERANQDLASRPIGLLLLARRRAYEGDVSGARDVLGSIRAFQEANRGRDVAAFVPNERVLLDAVDLATRASVDGEWQALIERSKRDSVEQDPIEVRALAALGAMRFGQTAAAVAWATEALAEAAKVPNFMAPHLRALLGTLGAP